MDKPGIKVYLSVITAMVLWSLTFVWFKIANEVYPPFSIVFIRLVISSIILFTVALFTGILQKIRRKDFKFFLLLTLFNPFLYFIAESIGLTKIDASLAAVIVSTIPLFVPIGARFFYGEKLTVLNVAGMLVSFIGVLMVIINNGFSLNASPVGIMLMLMAVFCAVGYTLTVKKLTYNYSAFSITAYQGILGAFLFLPLFLIFDHKKILIAEHSTRAIMALVYLAVFGSIIAFIFFNYSVKILGAAKTDFFTNIIPVLTAVVAWLILGESLNLQKIAGIAIVLAGLLMSQLPYLSRRKSRYISS
jgi:drug/metabolite transporter (DMT)-like permease